MSYSNPDRPWDDKIEIFLEDSQSPKTMKPLAIIAGKENQELMRDIWRPIINEVKKMKEFIVNFHGREIKIMFPMAKYMGDGKGCMNLLCLNGAYCYLCTLLAHEAQDIGKFSTDIPITRSVKSINDKYKKLDARWQKAHANGKTNKSFLNYFTSEERQGITGEPIVKEDELDMNNVPTNHAYSHFFDSFKSVFYQMHSRNRTQSGLSIAEEKEKLLKGRKKEKKKEKSEIKEQKCISCHKVYQGYMRLYPHLRKTRCGSYYGLSTVNKMKIDRDQEAKFKKQSKPLSDHEKIMKESKDYFTFIVKRDLHIAVNQVKAGNIN